IKGCGKLYNVDKVYKERFLAPLTVILKDPKEHMLVRKTVADVFREVLVFDPKLHSDIEAFKALLDIALDKDHKEVMGLRIAAINAVGAFGSGDGLDVLVKMLSDPEPLIRENAA